METQVLDVQGMTCGGCAHHISEAVSSVPGVLSAHADPETGTLTVAGDASVDEIVAAVTGAGYAAQPQPVA